MSLLINIITRPLQDFLQDFTFFWGGGGELKDLGGGSSLGARGKK